MSPEARIAHIRQTIFSPWIPDSHPNVIASREAARSSEKTCSALIQLHSKEKCMHSLAQTV
eukprot:scaffold109809_cov20-Prasinocladus_malaysianus.AAC.2